MTGKVRRIPVKSLVVEESMNPRSPLADVEEDMYDFGDKNNSSESVIKMFQATSCQAKLQATSMYNHDYDDNEADDDNDDKGDDNDDSEDQNESKDDKDDNEGNKYVDEHLLCSEKDTELCHQSKERERKHSNSSEEELKAGKSPIDLFTVTTSRSRTEHEHSCSEGLAEKEPCPKVKHGRRGKWKSFKEDVRRYSTVVKKALSRKDKNDVQEICIKPDVTISGMDVNECWTVDSCADQSAPTTGRCKGSASSSERTGSAGSCSSKKACAVEEFLEDDGIETIYDAEYQGGAS